MSELSYQMIRSANQAREADELRTDSRKKNLLVLVNHYLTEEGYIESAAALTKETNLDFSKYDVCDNVDLDTVLMEYESFYFIKFQRYPKITKKQPDDIKSHYRMNMNVNNNNSTSKTKASMANGVAKPTTLPRISAQSSLPAPPSSGGSSQNGRPRSGPKKQQKAIEDSKKNNKDANSSLTHEAGDDIGLQGLVIQGKQDNQHPSSDQGKPNRRNKGGPIIDYRSMIQQETRLPADINDSNYDPSDRLLKPLGSYLGYNSEWRELAMTISREIYLTNPDVRWDDIIGLDNAKRLVKEAVVYPIKYPQLFTGILSPWKGLLLYGPPGTGKTLLAKAVATECNTTFFNISASSIVSKWRGDSEKLVRVLFELARFHAPSTIFVDELDSLMSQRGGAGSGEHEGSRRMKTELLVQMDGLSKSDDLVFLLAASNLPWELDHAMLRRLEKRILVDLPTLEARRRMFTDFLPPKLKSEDGNALEIVCNINYDLCAETSEGYSGSDIKLVCKEAAMRVVRKIFNILENVTEGDVLHIKLDPVTTSDIDAAMSTTKPSAKTLNHKYIAWQKEFESV